MQHWLIKSEPDDFGLDDLERQGMEPWTGVRNYQARNNMRQMQVGDLVLFYHSNITPPEIVGVATVGSTPYPDPTQFDGTSDYFDPKATKENPRWQLVDMHFVERFKKPITLDELRENPFFQDMLVIKRGMRLSVQPVSETHFQKVIELGRLG